MTVMITNGNNVHPADYHAEVTAGKIVQVAEGASAEKVIAAREMRKKIETILTAHHTSVGDAEQAALKTHGLARLDQPLDASSHVNDGLVQDIVGASSGTILESHFSKPEVRGVIADILHHETRSQMHVHRLVAKHAAHAS